VRKHTGKAREMQLAQLAQLAQPRRAGLPHFALVSSGIRVEPAVAPPLQCSGHMQGESLHASVHVCVDCNEQSPQTETSYTLISSRYGWRLSLEEGPSGERVAIWRCPSCWTRHRSRTKSSLNS